MTDKEQVARSIVGCILFIALFFAMPALVQWYFVTVLYVQIGYLAAMGLTLVVVLLVGWLRNML